MKKTALISVLLTFLLLLSALQISSFAAPWDGVTVASSIAVGDGSEANPYIISDATELAKLAQDVNAVAGTYSGKYFKLGDDIDLGGMNWTPIGTKEAPFSGFFDGDGHTISGLSVTDKKTVNAGLFGYIKSGTVKNLTISAEKIYGNFAGGVAGYLAADITTGVAGSISNVKVIKGEIMGGQIGGIVGRVDTKNAYTLLLVTGCSVDNVKLSFPDNDDTEFVAASIKNCFVGGITGAAGAATISGCSVTNSEIKVGGSLATAYTAGGGIVAMHGASSSFTEIFNCFVYNVTMTNNASSPTTEGKNNLGGLVGRAGHVSFGVIKNCYTSKITINNVCGSSAMTGTFIGYVAAQNETGNNFCTDDNAIGSDDAYTELIQVTKLNLADINTADTVAKLNEGNTKTVWTVGDAYPVIDLTVIAENEVKTATYDPTPDTTAKVDVKTVKPVTTAKPAETQAPATTSADTQASDTAASGSKGCGSAASVGLAVIVTILGSALIRRKH